MANVSRRRFIGTALIAAAADLAVPRWAKAHQTIRTLTVDTRSIDVAERAATVFRIVDSDRSAPFRFTLDEPFSVNVANRLTEPTLLHWHGLTPPWRQDGVPSLPHPPIEAGTDHGFNFTLSHPGTFWMHSHFGLQLQAMLAAPLIVIDPDEATGADADIVVMLQDFSFRSAEEILAGLANGTHNMHDGTAGMAGGAGGDMPNMQMHTNDFDYDAYLTNDRTLDDPEMITVGRGDRIRLRIVNAASATGYHIDTGVLTADVLAVDGLDVLPVRGRRFPLSPGQRIDLAVSIPADGGSFPILALREGARERTGLLLATAGAPIRKIASLADSEAPALDLAFERRLSPAIADVPRPATQKLDVELNGSHRPYRWTVAVSSTVPDRATEIDYGERVELTIRNPTPMAHPMHLHGHRFQVIGIGADRFAGAFRDTVFLPPNSTVRVAFDANNPGRWALHCHHLYHMAAGMMTTLDYRGIV